MRRFSRCVIAALHSKWAGVFHITAIVVLIQVHPDAFLAYLVVMLGIQGVLWFFGDGRGYARHASAENARSLARGDIRQGRTFAYGAWNVARIAPQDVVRRLIDALPSMVQEEDAGRSGRVHRVTFTLRRIGALFSIHCQISDQIIRTQVRVFVSGKPRWFRRMTLLGCIYPVVWIAIVAVTLAVRPASAFGANSHSPLRNIVMVIVAFVALALSSFFAETIVAFTFRRGMRDLFDPCSEVISSLAAVDTAVPDGSLTLERVVGVNFQNAQIAPREMLGQLNRIVVTREDVVVVSLVHDSTTNVEGGRLRGMAFYPPPESEHAFLRVLLDSAGSLVLLVAHIEEGAAVVRHAAGGLLYRIALESIAQLESEFSTPIIVLGCESGNWRTSGVFDVVNTMDAIRRIGLIPTSSTVHVVLATLAGPDVRFSVKDSTIHSILDNEVFLNREDEVLDFEYMRSAAMSDEGDDDR